MLHAAELHIINATVEANRWTHPVSVTQDPAAQTLTLTLEHPITAATAELRLIYTGRLNRDLRGFYISEANGRKYAVTQLEATDARRMFPGFDEPRFKATS